MQVHLTSDAVNNWCCPCRMVQILHDDTHEMQRVQVRAEEALAAAAGAVEAAAGSADF